MSGYLQSLQDASGWLAAVVESTADAVIGLLRDGTIASWNPAAETLFGFTPPEVLGRSEEILAPADCRLQQQRIRARALDGATTSQFETERVRSDATTFPVSVSTSPIRDAGGAVRGIATITRDITARRAIERELQFLADHDPLTGLFNRRRLVDELERHAAHDLRYPHRGGALLIGDLDNFKQINDTLGHRAGDELITALAGVLRGRLRDTDVLARLGGDEFAVLLPHATLEQAADVAESLRAAIHDFEMTVDGRRLRTTTCIGVAPLDPELSATDALAGADVAMYDAKRQGRDRVSLAGGGAGGERRPAWSQRLRDALADDRLEIYAQPIVGIARPGDRRCELLSRLREGDELIPRPRSSTPPSALTSSGRSIGA